MLNFRMNMPFFLMALYGSIMIIVVLVLRALLKNKLPRYVFPILWGVVLLRLLIPFSLSSPLSRYVLNLEVADIFPAGGETTSMFAEALQMQTDDLISGAEISTVPGGEIPETAAYSVQYAYDEYDSPIWHWQIVMPVIYFLGFAAVAGVLGWQRYSYYRKLRGGLLLEHNETINAMLRSMDMGHILVYTNDEIASPLVSGLWNPGIYLPTRMDFQNTALLRNVLAHETMHIRRRDNWVKAVMLAALCLNWYNPLVWIMSKCLSSDLEAACDAAVLKSCNEEERKSYAFSLLAMAVTGNRATLLYSAFSRTEVEKRIKAVVNYKKATVFTLLFSFLFMACSTIVFATGGQAPFSSYLTSFCSSSNSRWGVSAAITRDIALGENAKERAEDIIFSVLGTDETNNPEILEARIKAALAEEFGVEKGAFRLRFGLCLSEEEFKEEYAAWDIVRDENGWYLYQGEHVRIYEDKVLGSYQSTEEGTVDIAVQRNGLGEIISVTVWREGDEEYDRRTEKRERYRSYGRYDTETEGECTVIEGNAYLR